MSNWRKRQALASDQKSWRALGLDSALWKGIEKNSGNVKTALGGSATTTTEGIVTALKMECVGGDADFTLSGNQTIYVSDPSLANVAVIEGFNKFTTPIDSSHNVLGKGLVFNVGNFTGQTVGDIAIQSDISGQKIAVINGGSGYSVGQTFSMHGVNPYANNGVIGQITGVTSTKIEPGRY